MHVALHCCRRQHWRIAAPRGFRDPAQLAAADPRATAGMRRTEGVDSVGQRDLTVLLVRVVRAGTRVVPEPDAKVLDLLRGLLEDLRRERAA